MLSESQWINAFIDESGNKSLKTSSQGVSNLYICVAVIVDDNQLTLAENSIKEISRVDFSGGEIKSSNIGPNHERRLKILNKVCEIDFSYFALIIDKAKLYKDSGFQYQLSFYKYINQMLYQYMANKQYSIRVYADNMGRKDFMDSCITYFHNQSMPDLFTSFQYSFCDSKTTPLIQLADLVAGTLLYCFDPEKIYNESNSFYSLLKTKKIGIKCWPLKRSELKQKVNIELNNIITVSCINRAIDFVDKYSESNDAYRLMQVSVVDYLLYLKEFEDNSSATSVVSDKLISHLKLLGYQELNKQQFTSNIITPLRYEGLILAGWSDGYRLATSIEDINCYLKHVSNIINPMLDKLNKARMTIKADTLNKYDILSPNNYLILKDLVDCYTNSSITHSIDISNVYEEIETDEP